ncbi:hypothetical protein DFJ74DRAFT_662943 [Hyaloraphidium curvatum]|nr:hypothetical protein DFJ74DRAFT_662943 [Hyaloraphidium curvatum]
MAAASDGARELLGLADALLADVYGDWTAASGGFPKPMPASEAGPSPSGQRRYLWTDAFAVATFGSQAMLSQQLAKDAGEPDTMSDRYLGAAARLIDAVHACLGNPRSAEFPMRHDPATGGYMGLRIGKEMARKGTDYGMEYDGMYWHYIDKWLFALARYSAVSSDTTRLASAVTLAKQLHPFFFVPGRGYRWKLNVDLTPIAGAPQPRPNHDALSALAVFHLLDAGTGSLRGEIADLLPIARAYLASPSSALSDAADPLGLGTHLWTSQWLGGPGSGGYLSALRSVAPGALARASEGARGGDPLDFRIYGALMGAQVVGDDRMREFAKEKALEMAVREMERGVGERPHSTINKVMLTAALNPVAFRRLPGEAAVEIP